MGILKGMIVFVLLVAAVGFAIHNDGPVVLKYYFGLESAPLPLFLWVFSGILVGLVFAGLMTGISKAGLRSRVRRLKNRLTDLEKERSMLRQAGDESAP